ncbi:DUF4389 domain-containing protein [Eionea flava]
MSNKPSDNEAVDGEIVSESSADPSSGQTETNASSINEASSETSGELKTRLLSPEHWLRGLFMLMFVVIACVASYVMLVLVIIQFVFALITGSSEERLQAFGGQLSQYLYQILRFITYNDEQKPFPFSDWPNDSSATGNE